MTIRAWPAFLPTVTLAALLWTGCSAPAAASDSATAPQTQPSGPAAQAPPLASVHTVVDTYHGVAVPDPYRWLEADDDPKVQDWIQAQNRYTHGVISVLPHVDDIRTRISEILTTPVSFYSSPVLRGNTLFASKFQPPKQQPFLVVMDASGPPQTWPESARVVVDPNQLDPTNRTTIDWFVPSPDGSLVAVSMSRDGTERGDLSIYRVATGTPVYEVIPGVNGGTAGGDVAWLADGSGFFYTRYPRGDERPPEEHGFYQQLYFHTTGTPIEQDRYELGKDLPRIAEIKLDMDHRTGRLLVTVQNGDGGEFAHYLRDPDGTWRQFSRFGDGLVQAILGPADDIYAVSRKETPRGQILRIPIADLDVDKAEIVVPQGPDTIITDFWTKATVRPTSSRLYVLYQVGGPSELRVFDLRGQPLPGPEQLPVSSVSSITPMGTGEQILVLNGSFVDPPAWYHFDAQTGTTQKTGLAYAYPRPFTDVEVVREFAMSKDGTRVPLNIIMPKGLKRNRANPTVVTGYGGFGVSIEPGFRPVNSFLLAQGMIFVVANLRGGNEYGQTWHAQGRLTAKQNVFDDFAAVLQHLVDRGYTSPDKIGITGGSNGGLLMGATLVQHPELVKAVVSFVGIYDSLRAEQAANGEFNITEYGTVQDLAQFRALHAYSPYHNVRDGSRYPATLLLTGANDPRVPSWHSCKMAARLQAATASNQPILLRVSADTGHGSGTALAERIEQTAAAYAFLIHHLGVNYQSRATP